MTTWTRRDMGGGGNLTVDLPDKIVVEIPVDAYKRLVQWCSMSRTIQEIFRAIDGEDKSVALEELETLRPALEAVHTACRKHWHELYREQNAKESDGRDAGLRPQ